MTRRLMLSSVDETMVRRADIAIPMSAWLGILEEEGVEDVEVVGAVGVAGIP